MEIDYAYVREILKNLKETEQSYMTIEEIRSALSENSSSRFHNHILILKDNDSIEIIPENYVNHYEDDEGMTIVFDDEASIRITYEGHKFLELLSNQRIMAKIKNLAMDKAAQIGMVIATDIVKKFIS